MRGVDIFSQLQSYASIGRKQFRWWPKLAWFLIDIAIMNAYVLYTRKHAAKKISRHNFRTQLEEELVSSFSSRKRIGRPTSQTAIRTTETDTHSSVHSHGHARSCSQCGRSRPTENSLSICVSNVICMCVLVHV